MTSAPTMARNFDPMQDATARAAAQAGMTVEAWLDYTDDLEARHKSRRETEQMLQSIPRYIEGAAA